MGMNREIEDYSSYDYNYEEDMEDATHRRQVRKMLEDRLERKRLQAEIEDEFDDYDWSDFK